MTTAPDTLKANGYGDFSNFQADSKNFTATVTRSNKQWTVLINPDTCQVTNQD